MGPCLFYPKQYLCEKLLLGLVPRYVNTILILTNVLQLARCMPEFTFLRTDHAIIVSKLQYAGLVQGLAVFIFGLKIM